MKIVNIIGGLGNQMFQYAFYLSLKESCKTTGVNILGFKGYDLHNGYELEKIFNINGNKNNLLCKFYLSDTIIGKLLRKYFSYDYNERYEFKFDSSIYSIKCIMPLFINGYWQNEKYFLSIKSKIYDAFLFDENKLNNNTKKLRYEIENVNSVSIHVRRGDYLSDENFKLFGGICTEDYYNKSVNYISELVDDPYYYVFTNDVEWAIAKFKGAKFKIVDFNQCEDSWQDMYLMSNCKHNIIANSSFSWWGAWLKQNNNKIVLAPEKWVNTIDDIDVIPANWIKI